jgi:hypothetical protein
MSDIELSFITVNYRTPDLADRLILSIRQFPPALPYEIIAVDNSSGDDSVEFIRSRHPDVKLVALSKNIGFGGGNNAGAKVAVGRILVLINSDCEIQRESFADAVGFMDQNPNVGIVGLKMFTPSGELEQSARGFPDPSTGLFGRSTFLGKLAQRSGRMGKAGLAKKNLMVDPDKTEPYDVDWVAGTIMLIRRECWDAVKGFDEGFFMYWEDADLCYRAREAGFRTVYFPGASVIHRPGSSASKDPAPAIRYFHQSAYRYVTKHISPGWSLVRGFAWLALNGRAAVLMARARRKARRVG